MPLLLSYDMFRQVEVLHNHKRKADVEVEASPLQLKL
jgi:hypothetical protein